ncbi:MAG: hypothetical protein HRT89_12500 [Lentisphaeria bacterium]|nr:hypothetical protein [Lentisphaeria bacterium]NQZ68877.1 hypothetical protein [Lentisphaeria bacterium]
MRNSYHQSIILSVFLSTLMVTVNLCADEILWKGEWDRSQVKVDKHGMYRFSLIQEKHIAKATGWVLKLQKGSIVKKQEIVQGKATIFKFGQDVVKITHKNLVILNDERDHMVEEGSIGSFVCLLITEPTYLLQKSEKFHKRDSSVLENSYLKIRLLAGNKGGIVEILEKSSKKNFVYLPSPREAGSDYSNAGLIDLHGGITSYAAERYKINVKEKNSILTLNMTSSENPNLAVEKNVSIGKNSCYFDLISKLKVTKGKPGKRMIRHKFSLQFKNLGQSYGFYPDGKGKVVKKRFVEMQKNSELYLPKCPWIVCKDKDTGSALVAVYEIDDDFQQMYMFFAPEFFCLEAFLKPKVLKPGDSMSLKARYFFMTGVDYITNVNKNGIIGIKGKKSFFNEGEEIPFELSIGLCSGAIAKVEIEIQDQDGKSLYSTNQLQRLHTGIMQDLQFTWRGQSKKGKYYVVAKVYDLDKNILIIGKESFSIIKRDNKKLESLANKLESRMAKLRRDKKDRPKLFKIAKLQAKIKRLLKKGNTEEAEKLYKKAFAIR